MSDVQRVLLDLNNPVFQDTLFSLRMSRSCRATAYREGTILRFLTLHPDHDSTYEK